MHFCGNRSATSSGLSDRRSIRRAHSSPVRPGKHTPALSGLDTNWVDGSQRGTVKLWAAACSAALPCHQDQGDTNPDQAEKKGDRSQCFGPHLGRHLVPSPIAGQSQTRGLLQCTNVKASSAPAARSRTSSGISNIRMCRSASAKSLRLSMAHPQYFTAKPPANVRKPAALP